MFVNLANNYDKFNYTDPKDSSPLPRVRTRVREYVENNYYVNNLQANYFQHLGGDFYGQIYAGYLETMYAGAGAEVLWRPVDSNWAFGVNGNYVKQRDWTSPQKHDEVHRLQRENRAPDRLLDAAVCAGCAD